MAQPLEESRAGADEKLSLPRKLLFCAQLLSNEASGVFDQLYTIPVLQTVGMPLRLASLVGVMSGPVAAVLMPLLGWISDKGANPVRRKLVVVALSTAFMVMGLACVIVANSMHLRHVGNVAGATVTQPWNTTEMFSTYGGSLRQASGFSNKTDGSGNTSRHVAPFKAWLAMLGFVIFDIGYDSVNSFVRARMLVCSPRAEHTSLLTLGLAMASIGGVLTSLLGMVDFGSLLKTLLPHGTHPPSDILVVQTSIQAAVLIILILTGFVLSLFATFGLPARSSRSDDYYKMDTERRAPSQSAASTGSSDGQDSSDGQPVGGATGSTKKEETEPLLGSQSSLSLESLRAGTPTSDSSPRKPVGKTGTLASWRLPLKRRMEHPGFLRSLLAVCFTCASSNRFTLMISDYVAKAIFGGDPGADPGSERLASYAAGVRCATRGFLVVAGTYLSVNMVHARVLNTLGHKAEFVLVQTVMAGCMVLLAVTVRLEVFFLLCVGAGMHRACRYVVPFAAANKAIQAEKERHPHRQGPSVGLAMSLVSGMLPLAYCTLYPWVGQLEEKTGVVATPLWLGAAFSSTAAVLFLFV